MHSGTSLISIATEGLTKSRETNFRTVAAAVQLRYRDIAFHIAEFGPNDGVQKLRAIEDVISPKQLVLVPLSLSAFGQNGWHIMPVVDMDTDSVTLLHSVDSNGRHILKLAKSDLVAVHNQFPGGNDIAYLETPRR